MVMLEASDAVEPLLDVVVALFSDFAGPDS
jgi:hypothetical protein